MNNSDKPRKMPAKSRHKSQRKPETRQEFIPGGLSRNQREALHHINETFARLFATFLAAQFRRDVSMTLLRIEPMGAEDFFHSIPQASFMAGFVSRPLSGKALLALTSNAIHCLLAKEYEPVPFGIPQTERGIMETVTRRGLGIFREAWINVIDLSPSIEWIDDELKIAKVDLSDTQILSIDFEVRIQDSMEIIKIGILPGFLVPIADQLNDPSLLDLWKDPGEKLTRSQLTAIDSLHGEFARSLARLLSDWSKTPVNASLISVNQISFEEFLRPAQRPGFMAGFKLEPLDGKALIAIDLEVVYSILDRHQGGNGDLPKPLRPLSEPETGLMEKVICSIFGIFRESWMPVTSLSPTIEFIESNPRFAGIVPPYFKVLEIGIQLRIQPVVGTLRVCLPLSTLKSVAEKLQGRNFGKT
ncbi:MAG: hypothetical protein HQM09_14660 [Candidatus Riflebacteria bacterium]|nr:hypothetical protein [Candidatus Riflebacteria bacterium]